MLTILENLISLVDFSTLWTLNIDIWALELQMLFVFIYIIESLFTLCAESEEIAILIQMLV